MDEEYNEKPVNLELHRKISHVVGGIIASPHLFFVYDGFNHVHMVYGPEKGNGSLSKRFGRNNHLNASIEIAAPFLIDDEAQVEVLRRLGEPNSFETDIRGNNNFRYDVSPEGLTYLLYVTLWPLEEYHHLSFRRICTGVKNFDASLVEKLSRI